MSKCVILVTQVRLYGGILLSASLLAGASIVHNIYKPDMTLPPVEAADGNGGAGAGATAGVDTKDS